MKKNEETSREQINTKLESMLRRIRVDDRSGLSQKAEAYVDGSYMTGSTFACGVVLFCGSREFHFSDSFINTELSKMHNVAGEIAGAMTAMQFCFDNDITELTIYHDYTGISQWCLGTWNTNKEGTKSYKEFYDKISDKVRISFVKVKGHSGNKYNEIADELAKRALVHSSYKGGFQDGI